MLTYFSIYFGLWSLLYAAKGYPRLRNLFHSLFFIILVSFIGFRWEVGADWNSYYRNFIAIEAMSFTEYLQYTDIGYALLNLFAYTLSDEYGIVLVNTFSAIIFSSGLIFFLRQVNNPELVFINLFLIGVVIVSMGLTRQSIALGIAFYLFGYILKFNRVNLLAYVGFLFHTSFIAVIGLVTLNRTRYRVLSTTIAIVAFLYWGFIEANLFSYFNVNLYLEQRLISEGALFKNILLGISITPYILYRKQLSKSEKNFWDIQMYFAILLLIFMFTQLTFIERFTYYLVPFQAYSFSLTPFLFQGKTQGMILYILVLLFNAIGLYLWLEYAYHAVYWLPYKTF